MKHSRQEHLKPGKVTLLCIPTSRSIIDCTKVILGRMLQHTVVWRRRHTQLYSTSLGEGCRARSLAWRVGAAALHVILSVTCRWRLLAARMWRML